MRYEVVTSELVTEVLRYRPDMFLSAVRPMKHLGQVTSFAVGVLWLMVSQVFWRWSFEFELLFLRQLGWFRERFFKLLRYVKVHVKVFAGMKRSSAKAAFNACFDRT
jgi:hypothetical protein